MKAIRVHEFGGPEVLRYEDVNVRGTAVLMHCLANDKRGSQRKVIVASSRAIYGEGK